MRRLLLICAAAGLFAVPAGATADARGDGTLSVKNATGSVSVVGTGALLGHCDGCRIWIDDPNPSDSPSPFVSRFDTYRQITDTKRMWCCDNLRFKVVGGFFRVRVVGTGIDLSAVATGTATLDDGSGGTYSVAGQPFEPMPVAKTSFPLSG
jgi:hypothetical protein